MKLEEVKLARVTDDEAIRIRLPILPNNLTARNQRYEEPIMRNRLAVFLVFQVLLLESHLLAEATKVKAPHILFIVADDFGYNDVG